ncbi:MAG: Gfo/Idh/MocA family oxidoreductase [Flavobacteriaceae bacterium]
MTKKLNFCIVGLGRAGHFHLSSIQSLDSCSLKYVVDPALDGGTSLPAGVSLLRDLKPALTDPELDAVVIATPTQFHFQNICDALKAGKHVFTEKPLGKTSEEIKTCFDLAEKLGLALYLGFQRRYDENFKALKASITKIGQVRTLKMSSRDNPKPSLDYLKISGNIFHDMLIHDFDMLQFLLGYKIPESVSAFGHAYDPDIEAIPDLDTVVVNLKYDDGLICTIDTSRTAVYGYDQRIELFAEKGMSMAENQRENTVEVHTSEGSLKAPANYSFPQRYKAAYAEEIADFVNGIQNNRLYNVSRDQCLLGHLIADAAHEAVVTNAVVDFQKKYGKELS